MRRANDRVWIIGASAGIGAALATRLADNGHQVAVSARNADALERLRSTLSGTGHLAVAVNVADAGAVAEAQRQLLQQWSAIDRVVFMAGIYTPMRLGELDLDETRATVEINLLGAFHVVEAAVPQLLRQGHGQLAICASVAGYRGLPRSQPYGATKAGLINLAESLRAEHGRVIDVKVINPGFVRSRLTDKNEFRMPALITPERAAAHIANGLYSDQFEIDFPKRFTLMMRLIRLLPNKLYFDLLRRRAR